MLIVELTPKAVTFPNKYFIGSQLDPTLCYARSPAPRNQPRHEAVRRYNQVSATHHLQGADSSIHVPFLPRPDARTLWFCQQISSLNYEINSRAGRGPAAELHIAQVATTMAGKKGGSEGNSKKAAGNARKAEAAARKAAAADAEREVAEAAKWEKGAKSNAKK